MSSVTVTLVNGDVAGVGHLERDRHRRTAAPHHAGCAFASSPLIRFAMTIEGRAGTLAFAGSCRSHPTRWWGADDGGDVGVLHTRRRCRQRSHTGERRLRTATAPSLMLSEPGPSQAIAAAAIVSSVTVTLVNVTLPVLVTSNVIAIVEPSPDDHPGCTVRVVAVDSLDDHDAWCGGDVGVGRVDRCHVRADWWCADHGGGVGVAHQVRCGVGRDTGERRTAATAPSLMLSEPGPSRAIAAAAIVSSVTVTFDKVTLPLLVTSNVTAIVDPITDCHTRRNGRVVTIIRFAITSAGLKLNLFLIVQFNAALYGTVTVKNPPTVVTVTGLAPSRHDTESNV